MLLVVPLCGASALLPTSPEGYLGQAARVRQLTDRPWAPEAGQLGNLRHVQITAPGCFVRIVSGSENRVYPGTQDVTVGESSRVLDADPNEQPTPRDVVLTTDVGKFCSGTGGCGRITAVTRAPHQDGDACFTLQLATAHDLLLGGDGLSLLVDHVRQPALRMSINPATNLQVWLEQVDIGLLSIGANASVHLGGTGKVDFLQAQSSNGASFMFLHEFQARNVGVSTTTTGTRWSIRIDADTKAGYYQPARAPGPIAKNYGIEIDGPIERLDVPAGHVDPYPLTDATRAEAHALHDAVLAHLGSPQELPVSDSKLPSASVAAAGLPADARERVAQVIARYLPASVKITTVALWKEGGRLEGMAPDAATARSVKALLEKSGEFIYVSGGGSIPRDGGQAFSVQLYFSCDAPGGLSACPAGDPATPGAYSEAQVHDAITEILGTAITVHTVRLKGETIELTADAVNEAEARAALERLGKQTGFMRLSMSTHGPSRRGAPAEIGATLKLNCAVPPKPDGICTPQSPSVPVLHLLIP